MKRMITKQMRDSFKVSAGTRISHWIKTSSQNRPAFGQSWHLDKPKAKKQRILILRRVVK